MSNPTHRPGKGYASTVNKTNDFDDSADMRRLNRQSGGFRSLRNGRDDPSDPAPRNGPARRLWELCPNCLIELETEGQDFVCECGYRAEEVAGVVLSVESDREDQEPQLTLSRWFE